MAKSVTPRQRAKPSRFLLLSKIGSMSIKQTAAMVPRIMYGVRLPSLVWVLSERCPNRGSMNRAKILSIAITRPVAASPIWKVFCRMSGIMLSYICQNVLMERNAKPTRRVRL